MITLRFLDDEMNEMFVEVKVVEKTDLCFATDHHIRSVEVENGWWELYNVNGEVWGFFEADESC